MEQPITDVESGSEHPQSFMPPETDTDTMSVTIEYVGGTITEKGVYKVESLTQRTTDFPDMHADDEIPILRVWYKDPKMSTSAYVDYDYGTVTSVWI